MTLREFLASCAAEVATWPAWRRSNYYERPIPHTAPTAACPATLPLPVGCRHPIIWCGRSPRTVAELQEQMRLGREYECATCGETWREGGQG